MENIFNRKIIFSRKKRINFNNALYLKIQETIIEDLSDYLFIFQNAEKIKNILFLNGELNGGSNNLNFDIFKNAEINNLCFLENDLDNVELLRCTKKTDLIIGINSFHNVNYLEHYFNAVNCCLNHDGVFCGNFFGNGNLSELKKIIITNDAEFSNKIYPRFNPTVSPESVIGLLQKSNFKNITISSETINFEFNFKNAINFLKAINENNYVCQMQKSAPNRKIFTENIPEKITLDFDIIKFYCSK